MSCARVDDHCGWGHLRNDDWRYPPYTPGSYDWAIPWTKEELEKRYEAWDRFLVEMGGRRVEMTTIRNELVELKPMELPSGLLFYMNYRSGSESPGP